MSEISTKIEFNHELESLKKDLKNSEEKILSLSSILTIKEEEIRSLKLEIQAKNDLINALQMRIDLTGPVDWALIQKIEDDNIRLQTENEILKKRSQSVENRQSEFRLPISQEPEEIIDLSVEIEENSPNYEPTKYITLDVDESNRLEIVNFESKNFPLLCFDKSNLIKIFRFDSTENLTLENVKNFIKKNICKDRKYSSLGFYCICKKLNTNKTSCRYFFYCKKKARFCQNKMIVNYFINQKVVFLSWSGKYCHCGQ